MGQHGRSLSPSGSKGVGAVNDETRITDIRPYPGIARHNPDEDRRRREERARQRVQQERNKRPRGGGRGGGLVDEFV